MKRFVLAITLTCALSSVALAGNIPSTDIAAPAPPPSPVVAVILAIVSSVI